MAIKLGSRMEARVANQESRGKAQRGEGTGVKGEGSRVPSWIEAKVKGK